MKNLVRITPPADDLGPQRASGTLVEAFDPSTEKFVLIKGVTRIELTAQPDDVWRATISLFPVFKTINATAVPRSRLLATSEYATLHFINDVLPADFTLWINGPPSADSWLACILQNPLTPGDSYGKEINWRRF